MNFLDDTLGRLPPVLQKALAHTGSILVGIVLAVLLHYVLYRIGLPSKPFIYVAF
jgi:mannose/fructose/N-acetylgalactosamine-specific phosphotransferase system component IIC